MPTGLLKRGSRYYLRRVIPKDLQEHYGRAVITRALGTASFADAKRGCVRGWLALDEEFERVRGGLSHPQRSAEATDPGDGVEALSEMSPTRISVAEVDRLRRMRERALSSGTLGEFTTWAKDTLRLTQAMLDGETEASHSLFELEGARNALKSVLTGEGAHYIAAARRAREALDQEKRASTDHSLINIVERWALEAKPIVRTRNRVMAIAKEFFIFAGEKRASRYVRADVIAYKDHLVSQNQTAGNVNVKLSLLSIPFSYAVRNNILPYNPVNKVSVINNRKAKEKRRSFNDLEIARIFSGPVHRDGMRPKGGAGEAAYWLPLLGLFTGARLTELGQLRVDDIYKESYATPVEHRSAWVFRFAQNSALGQRLKSEGSERRIPIHSALISLGFLEYWEQVKASGSDRIFPDISKPMTGDLMSAWSKWFGRYRRSLGVMGKDTPFHSFRHNFKHNARLVGINKEVHNALTGHETGDVADSYGALSFPLRPLVEGMAIYRVPGFILPPKP